MPIRLLTLQALELPKRSVMWDVGFCTGSISIEAKLCFPNLDIVSFEIRQECERLMDINSHRFGAPGIETVMGDFTEIDISSFPAPDAVFIGGHGGKLREIIGKLVGVMRPGGTIVFNSVSDESRAMFEDAAREFSLNLHMERRIALDDYNPITIMKGDL
ncbi:precorrin-6y C5,15-methyltransferase (decarboxylating), CbiE subunit [gut metagenome]|uniref:Precorrin-6y C5,15-methyltransferase (Decarboxylating), CbiE subunit n=1 Tax=gut metagenome TaxID=749906 RepID=J9G0X3_9ZZZZ